MFDGQEQAPERSPGRLRNSSPGRFAPPTKIQRPATGNRRGLALEITAHSQSTRGRSRSHCRMARRASGTSVSASVSTGATLELPASSRRSAGTTVANRTNITNTARRRRRAAHLRRQPTKAGRSREAESTTFSAGASLTANRIIQTALTIGASSSMQGHVTSTPRIPGNPLADP